MPGSGCSEPAFGLAGANLHTWTGWGSVTHWNAFVANLEMHGKGTFYDPRLTEPGWNLHTGAEIGIDDFQASRAPDGRYRTSPLRGLFTHTKGGFYHDGRLATLDGLIAHYDSTFSLGLTAAQRTDLAQYLLSL